MKAWSVVLVSGLLVACEVAVEVPRYVTTFKAKPVATAPPQAVDLPGRLASLLGTRTLPDVIKDAGKADFERAIQEAQLARGSCGGGNIHPDVQKNCDSLRGIAIAGALKRIKPEAATKAAATLVVEAKARGDGDEQFTAYIAVQTAAAVASTSLDPTWDPLPKTSTPSAPISGSSNRGDS